MEHSPYKEDCKMNSTACNRNIFSKIFWGALLLAVAAPGLGVADPANVPECAYHNDNFNKPPGLYAIVNGIPGSRLYLYSEHPSLCKENDEIKCRSDNYIVSGEKVGIDNFCNAWAYVLYEGKEKRILGWVERNRLDYVQQPIVDYPPVSPLTKFPERIGFIDRKGGIVVKPTFDFAGDFSRVGLAAVNVGGMPSGKWGFINTRGQYAVSPQYDRVSDFASNGLATVTLNQKTGFISTDGKLAIPMQFDGANLYKGQTTDHPENAPTFPHGLEPVNINGKWGYVNTQGKLAIPAQFEGAWEFADNGLANVTLDHRGGYIDLRGRIVIKLEYEGSRQFAKNGLAAVQKNGKWGYINADGIFVIPPQFDFAQTFGVNAPEDLAVVSIKDKGHGVIDAKGRFVMLPQSDKNIGGVATNGLSRFQFWKDLDKWGYVDTKGKIVIKPRFKNASDFSPDGLARVSEGGTDKLGGPYGYINSKGDLVIPYKYQCASDFVDGMAVVWNPDTKSSYIDTQGHTIISVAAEIDGAMPFSPSGYAKVVKGFPCPYLGQSLRGAP
jgi:hypothetical protein